jgi:FkbM family methyltransferase
MAGRPTTIVGPFSQRTFPAILRRMIPRYDIFQGMDSASVRARKLLRRTVGDAAYKTFGKLYRGTLGPDMYLRQTTGLIHVGANVGQERDLYDFFNMEVIWIEPVPEVFEELQSKISGFSKQRAYQCLLTDLDGEAYTFHIASETQSSSVYDLSRHKEMFPDIHHSRDLHLRSTTLRALLQKEQIDLSRFQTLILDTQGSELLVLKGAADILSSFRFIKVEAADFELYKGCCTADQLTAFVGLHGFIEQRRDAFAWLPEGGTVWDILYRRSPGPGAFAGPLKPCSPKRNRTRSPASEIPP